MGILELMDELKQAAEALRQAETAFNKEHPRVLSRDGRKKQEAYDRLRSQAIGPFAKAEQRARQALGQAQREEEARQRALAYVPIHTCLSPADYQLGLALAQHAYDHD